MNNIFYTILVICNIYKMYKIAREQMVFGKTNVTYLKTYYLLPYKNKNN